MADMCIEKSALCGSVVIPPSKSQAHRAIICAALSKGVSKISPIAMSKDIQATMGAVKAMGAEISFENGVLTVDGTNLFIKKDVIADCCESGSTLRFLIPVAACGGIDAAFIGSGLLPRRPIGEYLKILPDHGVLCESDGGLPLKISGKLQSGEFKLSGDVSSQYITGLLLALPLLEGDSRIILTTPLQSASYVNMTIDVMKAFGVFAEETAEGYFVHGNQAYVPCDFTVESDWSHAGFFFAAGALGGNLRIKGLSKDSLQGDRFTLDIFTQMGADITFDGDDIIVKKGVLSGIALDVSQIPDIVPAIAATCAAAQGKSKITGAHRLRIKESDRINSTVNALNALGVSARENGDTIEINGGSDMHCGIINSENDHRIAMAFAVLASVIDGKSTVTMSQCVEKSYPDFWEEFNRLGGKANVIGMGK